MTICLFILFNKIVADLFFVFKILLSSTLILIIY